MCMMGWCQFGNTNILFFLLFFCLAKLYLPSFICEHPKDEECNSGSLPISKSVVSDVSDMRMFVDYTFERQPTDCLLFIPCPLCVSLQFASATQNYCEDSFSALWFYPKSEVKDPWCSTFNIKDLSLIMNPQACLWTIFCQTSSLQDIFIQVHQ